VSDTEGTSSGVSFVGRPVTRSIVGLRSARSQQTRRERGHICRWAGPIPRDARTMHFDLVAVAKEENSAAPLLAEDLQERGSPEPQESVGSPGRHDTHLARRAHPCIAVHLDEHFPLQDAQDLVGVVVAMEMSDVVGRNGLHPHDQTLQPVLRASDHADVARSSRERHLPQSSNRVVRSLPVPVTIAAGRSLLPCRFGSRRCSRLISRSDLPVHGSASHLPLEDASEAWPWAHAQVGVVALLGEGDFQIGGAPGSMLEAFLSLMRRLCKSDQD
jgi:hypothetical protein